jgi:hypothetical protein
VPVSFFCALILSAAPTSSFTVETHGRFEWRFHEENRAAVEPLIRRGQAALDELAGQLGVKAPAKVYVEVAQTLDEFQMLQRRSPERGTIDWAVGMAFPDEDVILLRIDKTHLFTLEETFRHELSHLLVLAGVPYRPFPRWFSEGVAVVQSGEALTRRLSPILDAAITGSLIPLRKLERSFPGPGPALSLAYAQGASFVRYLIQREGPDTLARLIQEVRREGAFPVRFEAIYGTDVVDYERAWRRKLEADASWWRVLSGDMVIWFGLSALFMLAYFVKRHRSRRRLREMEAEELAVHQPPVN